MSVQDNDLYQFGPFCLDPVKRRLTRDGELVKLTPKAFETLIGGGHSGYLFERGKGFPQVAATSTDFLRWTLYHDTAAQGRLAADATATGISRWESA